MFLGRRCFRGLSTLDSLNIQSHSNSNGLGAVRIASLLPRSGAFKLTDGSVHNGPLALIGQTRLQWRPPLENTNNNLTFGLSDSLNILKALRPLPDIIIVGAGRTPNLTQLRQELTKSDLVTKYGLIFEIMDTSAAANTFNSLLDDGSKRVVSFLLPLYPRNPR